MENNVFMPSSVQIQAVLEKVAPDCKSFHLTAFSGDNANHTYLIDIEFEDKASEKIVFRRYNLENGDCENKARREYAALTMMHPGKLAVPEPILLDADGTLMGSPGIVTRYVPGIVIDVDTNPQAWVAGVSQLATALAQIHSTAIDSAIKPLLMNGNAEIVWFLNRGTVPEYMSKYPDGAAIWHAVAELWQRKQSVQPGLLHLDIWSGNVLWQGNSIATIMDWEEAAYGDPGIDVGYCRMEYFLIGQDEAAEEFLRQYERETGHPVENLPLWELAAAVRPLYGDYLTSAHMPGYQRFVTSAMQRSGL
ncbi:MAG: aminoglycoside phosphotransferase family protein [Anaerolineae bacterium]|nr:aminoglycoside phosphotransferase family protein [Anaerolineae bacterium]